jgi:hypothetical protein
MTFAEAVQEVVIYSGKGIRRPCWKDKTLRINDDKQFADARVVHKGKDAKAMIDMEKDIQHKQMTNHDGSGLFFQTDKADYSDGGVYNGKALKKEFVVEGLPYGREDYLADDWEIYGPDNLKGVTEG